MSILSNLTDFLFGNSSRKQAIEKPTTKPKAVRKSNPNRVTKLDQVRSHLLEHGSITSWEAIDHYGATRLSAIIFILKDRGHDIESIQLSALDRNRNTSNFVRYVLHQH